ncbi:MAG TPA: PQQ-binding-like beta-propeller repeat protein [Ktedonobacteraceae bacterium]|nr:PQQ-binding-like beta-propeller repeat protein [Ktedonobacteraceae bacterium]
MRNFTRTIFVVVACLVCMVPVSFALAASSRVASGNLAFSICPTSGSGHWPMFGYTAAGTRDNTAEKTLNPSNVGTLVKDWSFIAGNAVQTTPAIMNGVIYFGSNDRKLYALNASTGKLIWSYTTGLDVIGSPAVANGVAYVGSNDKKLYALRASTGNCSGRILPVQMLWVP